MKTSETIWVVMFLLLGTGLSQTAAPSDNSQTDAGAPPAAVDVTTDTTSVSNDNPPISGLDQPSLEPRAPSRSFLIPGAHVNEAADSNVSSTAGHASFASVTRAMGSVTLQKLWSRYDVALDYVGGAVFYSHNLAKTSQLQQMDGDQRIRWRTGQLAIRDTFSYLPEGSFGGSSFGGAGILGTGGGLAAGGFGGIFSPGQFASLGQQPRITNVTVADITQSLNPRSSMTLAGSYGLVNFTNNSFGFIDSRQETGQAGYNYQINRKDQLALVYAFQEFHYPGFAGAGFNTNVVNVLYGHRISGRMDLVVGGGPQYTRIGNPLQGTSSRFSGSGRLTLRYRFSVATVGVYYDHYNTSGSGLFAGAESDLARVSATRPFGRLWDVTFDVGYTHNKRLTTVTAVPVGTAQSFDYAYAGGTAHRQLGRDISLYMSYQFNDLHFDHAFCTTTTICNRTSLRQVGVVGFDWHPHPIRLD